MTYPPNDEARERTTALRGFIIDVLLIAVLVIGAFLRLTGVNWDELRHLHPDERFLTMVETALQPVNSFSEYFNTETSTMNPHNQGYPFYVYGTLPIFIVRYVGEWMGQTGYDEIHLVGRQLSAVADLLTVFLVFLIGARLYGRRVGLIAAAFSSFAVLQIQLSHYFTVDTFTNLFAFLAIYMAVWIMTRPVDAPPSAVDEGMANQFEPAEPEMREEETPPPARERLSFGDFVPYLLFGMALGMAAASKINAVVLAVLLPLAVFIRWTKLRPSEQSRRIWLEVILIGAAAVASIIAFRIFQPYAFSGPGFFGFLPNEKWVANLQELQRQASGDFHYPPNVQWAKRPIWFSWVNMVAWGMGLPYGLLAWTGFLWMGLRILKGQWREHLLLWGWTGIYFAWQSQVFNRTMRYQFLIYPTLAIIAAWALARLWDKSVVRRPWGWQAQPGWRVLASLVGILAIGGSLAWAYAFTRIYHRPMTRIEGSRWIYQNIPGAINFQVVTPGGTAQMPLPYHWAEIITKTEPYVQAFKPEASGILTQIRLPRLRDLRPEPSPFDKVLLVTITAADEPDRPLTAAVARNAFTKFEGDPRGEGYDFVFENPVVLDPNRIYLMRVNLTEGDASIQIADSPMLTLVTDRGELRQPLPAVAQALRVDANYYAAMLASQTGTLAEVTLPYVLDESQTPGEKTLRVDVTAEAGENGVTVSGTAVGEFLDLGSSGRGTPAVIRLDQPLPVEKGKPYSVEVSLASGEGAVALRGSAPIDETTWDDDLPQPVDGFWPYDYTYGIYQNGLNFEMYWDDNADKLARFQTLLDQGDTIFISSNRQWGTTTRVPESYPLTAAYYRSLLGCPADKEITWCYSVAQPGMFTGTLGYELAAVFQSDPNLGPVRFNTQFAEEAFTVYDHPKVLIFRKRADYDSQQVRALLASVDLSKRVDISQVKSNLFGQSNTEPPPSLMLPDDRLAGQRAGGTWSALFDRAALINQNPVASTVLWYLAVLLLGMLAYPLVRLALPSLPDRGYPLSRLTGMMLVALMAWLAGSAGLPVTRAAISAAVAVLALVGLYLAIRQRRELGEELRTRWRYFLLVEGLFLAFFAFDLLIRLGNPDLWHPFKGGEKPMDFSYLNAVIKSTTFPPYDPWFAGGYLNYYYYGFVIVGLFIKWLGIVPATAYNLVLPTLFAFTALGAFSAAYNLIAAYRSRRLEAGEGGSPWLAKPVGAGTAAALLTVVLSNLGTVRMIWQGWQRLAAPDGNIENLSVVMRWVYSIQGLVKNLSGTKMTFYPGDWYWIPSRTIRGEPITEFPFFTFLYADLHAHMIALPVTILALSWALSVVLSRACWGEPVSRRNRAHSLGASLLVGALAIGALRPTNTWDWPTYMALGVVAVLFAFWRRGSFARLPGEPLIDIIGRYLAAPAVLLALVALAALLYQPFSQWFAQAYNTIDPWKGDHTPFWSYTTHWGLFLFILISWMAYESIHWMATTPMSALVKLRPYRVLIYGLLLALVIAVGFLLVKQKVEIAWFVLPLAMWAAVLLLRPGQPDAKRAVLFMVGTAFFLTILVEVVVLRGDIGRMNTVFKFYFQAWTLFAISSAAALAWLFEGMRASFSGAWRGWRPSLQAGWQAALVLLLFGAALGTAQSARDKINDRMAPDAPRTLDGMTYMDYSRYNQKGVDMDLSQDARAIRWMQENVEGSPVIVEGHTDQYYWGSRFSIYTGLPGVVGWTWHQIQQRAVLMVDVVNPRVIDVDTFYKTVIPEDAAAFLKQYDVQYIVVGQLEKALYPGPGLDKFERQDGKLWDEVYRDADTAIYKVR